MESNDYVKGNEYQNQELRGDGFLVYLRRTPFFL